MGAAGAVTPNQETRRDKERDRERRQQGQRETARSRDPETEEAGAQNSPGGKDTHRDAQPGARRDSERLRAQRDTGRERTELERQRRPQGQRARAPCPLPTHVLEERVAGGPGGRRGGPPGLGRRRPDQTHGEQPRARHGAATHSATAQAGAWLRLPLLDAAASDLGCRPPIGAGADAQGPAPRGSNPASPPPAQLATGAPSPTPPEGAASPTGEGNSGLQMGKSHTM